MKEIIIKKDGKKMKFNLPTKWEDVSIEQFCKTFTIDREDKHDMETAIEHVKIFTNIDEELLLDLTTEQFVELTTPLEFINTELESKMSESVVVDGEEYYLHTDFQNYTLGEQISCELILEQANMNILSCMDKMLCVMLRKKVDGKLEKFDKSFMDREGIFKQIPITDIYQMFSFFSNSKGA